MNTFLDPVLADDAKQQAMKQVYSAAPEKWRFDTHWAVIIVACCFQEFISDDVWKILYKPPEGRALGPIMAAAARAGYIEKLGKTNKTAQVSRHHTDVNVWKSKVFGAHPSHWTPVVDAWKKVLL